MVPAQPLVTDVNFGAWILKAAPAFWDLDSYIDDGNSHFDAWSVVDNYRTQMMSAGQRAFLWAGKGYTSTASGVIGAGEITGPAFEGTGDEYWADPSARQARHLFAAVDIALLDQPVLRADFLSDRVLRDAEIIRQPQMSNPTFLTKEELAVVEELLAKDRP